MSNTQRKLEEAKYFFKRMLETYQIPFEFECNLQAFISSARSVTFVMQAEYSKKAHFDEWYEKKVEEMQTDELLDFFKQARTKSIHEESLTPGTIAHIKHIYIKSIPQGWGFAISGKGEPVWISPKGERVHAFRFDSQVERVYLFDNPPKSFKGTELKDFSAVALCNIYLVYLSDLVKEVNEKL